IMKATSIKDLLLAQSLRPDTVCADRRDPLLVPGFTTDKFRGCEFRELPLDDLVKLIGAMIEAGKEEQWSSVGPLSFGYDGIHLLFDGPNCTVPCGADLTLKQVPPYATRLPEVAQFGAKIKDAMR